MGANSAENVPATVPLQGMADKNKHPFSFHISRVLSRFMFFPKSAMSEPFKMVNWIIVGQEMDQVA